MSLSSTLVNQVRNDAVDFAVGIANDNSHGYSQATRSLYNITNPTSFDCSSLVLTAFYYAFVKNGISPTPKDLGCSYTGNMLNLKSCGFEVVATNQTAHSQMIKGDIELNTTYHTALAIDPDNIVHARSSEGTSNTIDDSGNEIRTQAWYLYSHGWTHRLRFTGNGLTVADTSSSTGSDVGNTSYCCTGIATAVSKTEMNIRKKAGTDQKCIGTIPYGTAVEVLKVRKGGWYKIVWPGAECGYAFTCNKGGNYYTYKPNTTYTYQVKASDGLNLRKGAGMTKKILTTLPNGFKVTGGGNYCTVSGTNWMYVSADYNGTTYLGFCSGDYLKKV